MSYVHVKTEPARTARENPFHIYRCYYCGAMLVLRGYSDDARHLRACAVCKR